MILPSDYTCFQRHFLDSMPSNFFSGVSVSMNNYFIAKQQALSQTAGEAMTAEIVSDAAMAAGTAVCPIVGKGLGYAAGWVAAQGATIPCNILDERLRTIGPSNEQLAQYLPI